MRRAQAGGGRWGGALTLALALSACAPPPGPEGGQCLSAAPAVVSIPQGEGRMGSDAAYPEERPARPVRSGGFSIDAVEVSNAAFARFVAATGYITDAERPQPGFEVPGAAVFAYPTPENPSWWRFVEGASWRAPEGPGSSIEGLEALPVVQVSQRDAVAYAAWAGGRLPTETEWEFAARAGSTTRYVWGDALAPKGVLQANTWQGPFPVRNSGDDGYLSRAPGGCFPPNGFGLYDMIGNVWEWTATPYDDPVAEGEARYTIKGGSYLCAENYCHRFRASARQAQEAGLPTNHIGFRIVYDADQARKG